MPYAVAESKENLQDESTDRFPIISKPVRDYTRIGNFQRYIQQIETPAIKIPDLNGSAHC